MATLQQPTNIPGAVSSGSPLPKIRAREAEGEQQRVTAWAFIVGLPLLIGICLISVYADMVSQVVQFGVVMLAPPAVAALFFLAIANRALLKLCKLHWLTHGDLVVIYTMLLVGVLVSTRGVIEKLIPPLAFLPYFATPENKYNDILTPHLPHWAIPFTPGAAAGRSDVVRAYYEGLGAHDVIPWMAWVGPLVCWFALIACVLWVFLCLATILRRQWVDNEQLRFPLVILPLATIRDEIEGQPFFNNRMMWLGVLVPVIVFGVNGLNKNFPDWPRFNIDLSLGAMFTENPWNQMEGIQLYVSLAAIGFGFFLSTDLLFSLWFFFVLTRIQDVAAVMMGGQVQGIGTHNATMWTGYQAAGAYLVLVFAQFKLGRPYYKQVWRTAFGRRQDRPLDDSDEMFSYRTAIIGLVLGFAGIIGWLAMAGMNPILSAAQMGIYIFFIAMIMSRAVCEAGLLMTETSFLPSHLISLVYPLPAMGPQNLTIMAMTNMVFTRDMRGIMLAPFLDAQKLAGQVGMRPRAMRWPLMLAVVVSFVAASYFFLYFNYHKGGLALYSYTTQGNPRNMFNTAHGQIVGAVTPPGATEWGGFASGIVVTILLTWLRANFTWFPLHPLAFAIAPTWAMYVFSFPFFVAWVIKSLVMRFGGIESFRKLAPFMLGLVLGEFMMAVMWAVMNMWRGWSTPSFPWP